MYVEGMFGAYSKSGNGRRQKQETAEMFLREIPSDGGAPATEVIAQAGLARISKKTLERAKAAVGVKSSRVNGHGVWQLGNDKVIMLIISGM